MERNGQEIRGTFIRDEPQALEFALEKFPRSTFSIKMENKQLALNPLPIYEVANNFEFTDVNVVVVFKELVSASALLVPKRESKDFDILISSKIDKLYAERQKREALIFSINHSLLHELFHLKEYSLHRGYSGNVIYSEDKAEDFAIERMKPILGGEESKLLLVAV